MPLRAHLVLGAHALALWVLCGATMGLGLRVASLDTALAVHAVAAPVFATLVSWLYFARFGAARPLVVASWFLAFIVAVDFLVVALLVNRSLDMFRSLIGTWIPFALIFAATLATGAAVAARRGTTGRRGGASG